MSTHVITAGSPPHTAAEQRRPWTVLALMLAAQFMVVLDVSVVNVALPSIGRSLSLSSGEYQWAVSAYVLFSGGFLLLGGRLADLFDRRRMFLTGLAVFTVASSLSGLAGSALMLIAARAAQGTGAAILTPAAMSIVMSSYAGRQRATALAVWGTVASMGIAAGVLFGGILTSAFDWRAVFFINVPIGVLTFALTRRTVAAGGRRPAAVRRLDVPGAVTAVAGLVALVYAIEGVTSRGWSSPVTVSAFAASAVLLAAFAMLERRVGEPLVPPRTWRVRSLISASAVMAGVTGAVVGAIFLTSLFLQQVLGSSPVVAGLQFLPLAAVITASAAVASKLLPTVGPRGLIAAGLVIAATGALLLSRIDGDAGYLTGVLPGFALLGLGVGPMFVAISVAAMSEVPHDLSGLASGLMMTGHEVGAALGVAMLTAVGGDLTTRSGLIAGYPDAFLFVTGALLALLVPTGFVPRRVSAGNPPAALH
ncbi:MAG TPA: MFS transporter [Actinoplanes sp.]|jgi:EmrB/QacA subfamily drug resistance transporter